MPPREPTSLEEKLEEELEHLEALRRRLRLDRLLRHFPPRPVWAIFVCIHCFIAVALLSIVAMLSRSPFVFPSLGPTAYVFFFTPRAAAASPKHAFCGHAIGLICGWLALRMTGLTDAGPVTEGGVTLARVLAAALSMAATGALMILLSVGHPPAGATTLIVSLGFITHIRNLLVIQAAVVVLILHAIGMNRFSGVPYPLWSPRPYSPALPRPKPT